jgi:phage antirepressor YoqD-like protein
MKLLSNKTTISSLELVEQINLFRKEDGKQVEILHKSLLEIIRDEFEEEIAGQNILPSEYKDKSGKANVMFELTTAQAKQVLVRESKMVRKAVIAYIEKLESMIIEKLPSYQIENRIDRANAWIEEEKERILLQESNEKLQFRSDFVDVCFDTDGMFSMEETAKILKLPFGRNEMMKKLREKGVLMASNTPTQRYISNGSFKVVETLVENGSFKKLVSTTYATQKGIGYIHKMFADERTLIACP